MKRVVFTPAGDPARAHRVAQLLTRAGVEVMRVSAPVSSVAAHDYFGGAAARKTFGIVGKEPGSHQGCLYGVFPCGAY
jgi:hypothetical protein